MKKPTKHSPHIIEVIFCERAIRAQCATCARNLSRYAIRKTFRVEPPCDFASSECDYYIEDAHNPEVEQ